MRWLIVGPYAPERGDGAAHTVAEATARLDAGDEVHVVSPRPSAAHEHRALTGPRALLGLLREVDPATGFWARVEPGVLLTRDPSRGRALVERLLLSGLLRRAGRAVLDVGDAALFPGGRAGRLVFEPVDEVVVHSPEHRDLLLAAGAKSDQVRLRSTERAGRAQSAPAASQPRREVPPADWSDLVAGGGRAAIEAAVQRRAQEAPINPDL